MSKTAAPSDLEAGLANGHAAKKAKLHLSKNHAVALVLDYGSQYTQLIGRRIREAGVYSMLKPADVTLVSLPKCTNRQPSALRRSYMRSSPQHMCYSTDVRCKLTVERFGLLPRLKFAGVGSDMLRLLGFYPM